MTLFANYSVVVGLNVTVKSLSILQDNFGVPKAEQNCDICDQMKEINLIIARLCEI